MLNLYAFIMVGTFCATTGLAAANGTSKMALTPLAQSGPSINSGIDFDILQYELDRAETIFDAAFAGKHSSGLTPRGQAVVEAAYLDGERIRQRNYRKKDLEESLIFAARSPGKRNSEFSGGRTPRPLYATGGHAAQRATRAHADGPEIFCVRLYSRTLAQIAGQVNDSSGEWLAASASRLGYHSIRNGYAAGAAPSCTSHLALPPPVHCKPAFIFADLLRIHFISFSILRTFRTAPLFNFFQLIASDRLAADRQAAV